MNAAQDTPLVVTWEHEQGDWMTYAGDPIEEYREKFASGAWEVLVAYVKDPETGATLASLSGIVLEASDPQPYRTEVEQELLQEALEQRTKDRASAYRREHACVVAKVSPKGTFQGLVAGVIYDTRANVKGLGSQEYLVHLTGHPEVSKRWYPATYVLRTGGAS